MLSLSFLKPPTLVLFLFHYGHEKSQDVNKHVVTDTSYIRNIESDNAEISGVISTLPNLTLPISWLLLMVKVRTKPNCA